MIIDLAQHQRELRSEPIARKDKLLLRYRSFSLAVLCAISEIERAQKEQDDPNVRDTITMIAIGSIRGAFDGLKKAGGV